MPKCKWRKKLKHSGAYVSHHEVSGFGGTVIAEVHFDGSVSATNNHGKSMAFVSGETGIPGLKVYGPIPDPLDEPKPKERKPFTFKENGKPPRRSDWKRGLFDDSTGWFVVAKDWAGDTLFIRDDDGCTVSAEYDEITPLEDDTE